MKRSRTWALHSVPACHARHATEQDDAFPLSSDVPDAKIKLLHQCSYALDHNLVARSRHTGVVGKTYADAQADNSTVRLTNLSYGGTRGLALGIGPQKERAMPQFHLNVFVDSNAVDEEGIERANLEIVKLEAIVGARNLVANLIRYGKPVHRTHRIEITDEAGNLLHKILFGDVIDLRS